MRDKFITAIQEYQADYGVEIEQEDVERLANFYDIVQGANPLLHLVAPCSPGAFATRHILESLTLLRHLPKNAVFADVGTGAGLPAIPCLIVRDDLRAVLIESKKKKTDYLETATLRLGIGIRAVVVNSQFDEVKPPQEIGFITCRALDKFVEKLPRLFRWSARRTLLLFGGPALEEAIGQSGRKYEKRLMPLSERRYLFVVPQDT